MAEPSGTTALTYNVVNALTNAGFAYDADGNLLSDGARNYSWDAENRLVAITYKGHPGQKTGFAYDGLDRRTKIIETPSSGKTATYDYLWCGARVCQQRAGAAAVARLYYSEGEVVPAVKPANDTLFYYGPDQLGSARDVSEISPLVSALGQPYDYDPYGNPIAAPTGKTVDFRYAGMLYHANSGLYLTQYRAYDPRTARWLSRDPLGETRDPGPTGMGTVSALVFPTPLTGNPTPTRLSAFIPRPGADASQPGHPRPYLVRAGDNLYLYGNANPESVIDPTGLDGIVGGISGAISGAIIGGTLGLPEGGIGAVPGAIIGGIIGGIGGYGPPPGFHFPWYNPSCPASGASGGSTGSGDGSSGPVMYDPSTGGYVPFNPATAPVSSR